MKEEELKSQISLLKSEIDQYKLTKEILMNKNTTDKELKNYIFQLETDLSLTKGQISQLIKEKSEFDA